MTLGTGTGTLYQFAGDQRGTDGTNQSQGGFGILSGSNQISPIIWVYGYEGKNAFQVRRKGYSSTVQNGLTLLHVGADGNVGIGTSSSSYPLHISSSSENHQLRLQGTNGKHSWIQFYPSGANVLNWKTGVNTNGFNIYDVSNAQYRFNISNTGNVGIGATNTKGFKLGVNGKIAATEVKVATYANWSDFVFKNDYNLATLAEVENHIKEKGHLKDIPSAEDVKKDGFFLGEMDAKLLQKIEELTLYLIEQNKKIEELRKEIITLKNE